MREGWIKSHRKITDSAVWCMPPLHLKVWQYLLHAACFTEKRIPMKDGSFILLEKGQHLTSIRVISDKVSWYERGIQKSPNPKTISEILDWLISQDMIRIDNGKNDKQYTLITIMNWEYYQDGIGAVGDAEDGYRDEVHGNKERTKHKQLLDIKKNGNKHHKQKEEKNMKEQKEQMTCSDEDGVRSIYADTDFKFDGEVIANTNVNVNTNANTGNDGTGSDVDGNVGIDSNADTDVDVDTKVGIGDNADADSDNESNIQATTVAALELSLSTNDLANGFEEFWRNYPRKHGREKAYQSFVMEVKKGARAADLIDAATGYSSYCSTEDINRKYIKYPCNFISKDKAYKEFMGYSKATLEQEVTEPENAEAAWNEVITAIGRNRGNINQVYNCITSRSQKVVKQIGLGEIYIYQHLPACKKNFLEIYQETH